MVHYWLLGITLLNLGLLAAVLWHIYTIRRDLTIVVDVLVDVTSRLTTDKKTEEDKEEYDE